MCGATATLHGDPEEVIDTGLDTGLDPDCGCQCPVTNRARKPNRDKFGITGQEAVEPCSYPRKILHAC
jgi:hypothetical protein